jgi:cytochrome P450
MIFFAMIFFAFAVVIFFLFRAPPFTDGKILTMKPFHPFFGNFLFFKSNFSSGNIWHHIYEGCLENKFNVWGVSIPTQRIIMISQPDLIKYVSKDSSDVYIKGEKFHDTFRELLGDGIFAVDGHRWREQRRAALPMFSRKLLSSKMSHAFSLHANTVLHILDTAVARNEPVDLQSIFFRYTLDAICDIAFSAQLKTLEKPHPFGQAFDAATSICAFRFMKPYWKVLRTLNLSDEGKLKHHMKIINDTLLAIISQRSQSDVDTHGDMLSLFLQKRDSDPSLRGDEGVGIEEEAKEGEAGRAQARSSNDPAFLRDLVLNFVLAGRDTTAWAMTAASWLLFSDQNTSRQFKAFSEAKDAVDGDIPTFNELKALKYTEACFFEALRLFPSVPHEVKFAARDDTLPTGVEVKRGDMLSIPIYAMARNESLWGSDAAEFNPERWLEPGFKPNEFTYPIFNTTPRLCLGKEMATIEAKLLLATLFKRYEFALDPRSADFSKTSQGFMFGITMTLQEGLWVTVKRR